MKHFISAILFLSIVPACGGYHDEEPAPTPPKVPQKENEPKPPVPGGNTLVPKLEALDEPNRYGVLLKWRTTAPISQLCVHRSGGPPGVVSVTWYLSYFPEGRFLDQAVSPGMSYEYALCLVKEGKLETLDKHTIRIPRDLVVGNAADLDAGRGIDLGRIFLKTNAVLVMGPKELKMYADELISDNALVRSFPGGEKASKGYHGHDAGEVLISVRRAHGSLRIETNGQHGGEGNDGAAGAAGGPGTPGNAGDWMTNPEWRKYATNSPENAAEVSRKYYLNRRDEFWWGQRLSGNQPAFMCKTPPTDGGQGQPGAPGQDGGDGGRGGSTGRVYVEVKEQSDIKIEVKGEPGLGAIGGRGGKGGAGGPGGPPGALDAGFRCPPAKQGPTGTPGIDGRQGRPGANGTKEPTCIRINGRETGNCTSFKKSGMEDA